MKTEKYSTKLSLLAKSDIETPTSTGIITITALDTDVAEVEDPDTSKKSGSIVEAGISGFGKEYIFHIYNPGITKLVIKTVDSGVQKTLTIESINSQKLIPIFYSSSSMDPATLNIPDFSTAIYYYRTGNSDDVVGSKADTYYSFKNFSSSALVGTGYPASHPTIEGSKYNDLYINKLFLDKEFIKDGKKYNYTKLYFLDSGVMYECGIALNLSI